MLIEAWFWAALCTFVVSAAALGWGFVGRTRSSVTPVWGLGLFGTYCLSKGMLWYSGTSLGFGIVFGLALLWMRRHSLKSLVLSTPLPIGRDWLWVLFPAAYYLARVFAAGLPQQHSDPLYYHLSAPRYWAELGRITITPEHPSYAQAATWEAIYGIPQFIFGLTGVRAHVITELVGQWMHMWWGQLGCLLVGTAILWKLVPKLRARPGLSVFVAWLCTTMAAFEWTGCLAKSDYVLMLFVLAAIHEILATHFIVAGALMGFAFGVKSLGAWAAIAAVALVPPRFWWKYGLAAALGALPVLLRNFIQTGNPLFPMFDDKIGPHWISSWWINHNASFGGGLEFHIEIWGWLWNKMFEKGLAKVLLTVAVAGIAVELWKSKKTRRQTWRWMGFFAIQLALALTMLRWRADGRYGNFIASGMAIFGSACLLKIALLKKRVDSRAFFALLPLGLLVNVPLDIVYKIPRDYLFQPMEKYVEFFHPVYDVQKWVHENVRSNEKILFLAEKQHFFLDRPFETVVEMKKWEDFLTPIKSREELFRKVREAGYRYVHFSPQAGGFPIVIRPYWPSIVAIEKEAVFKSPNSLVFDLSRY